MDRSPGGAEEQAGSFCVRGQRSDARLLFTLPRAGERGECLGAKLESLRREVRSALVEPPLLLAGPRGEKADAGAAGELLPGGAGVGDRAGGARVDTDEAVDVRGKQALVLRSGLEDAEAPGVDHDRVFLRGDWKQRAGRYLPEPAAIKLVELADGDLAASTKRSYNIVWKRFSSMCSTLECDPYMIVEDEIARDVLLAEYIRGRAAEGMKVKTITSEVSALRRVVEDHKNCLTERTLLAVAKVEERNKPVKLGLNSTQVYKFWQAAEKARKEYDAMNRGVLRKDSGGCSERDRLRSRAQAFLCTMVGYGLLLRQSSIKELKITPPPRCYYSWHSLRIGGATALARQNSPVPRETLQAWGNWKSLAAMENYFQFDSPPGLHDKLFWNYLVSAADWT